MRVQRCPTGPGAAPRNTGSVRAGLLALLLLVQGFLAAAHIHDTGRPHTGAVLEAGNRGAASLPFAPAGPAEDADHCPVCQTLAGAVADAPPATVALHLPERTAEAVDPLPSRFVSSVAVPDDCRPRSPPARSLLT